MGTVPSDTHWSADIALTTTSGDDTIRSGLPICHSPPLWKFSGGGMSAGFPRGAPLSTHFAILAISSSLSEGSSLYCWMPMSFSMYQGGIAPRWVRSRGPRLDRPREGSRVFVRQQRHGRQGVGPMTRLTMALQDRCDIFREGHLAWCRRGPRLGMHNDGRDQTEGANGRSQLDFHRAHSRVDRATSITLLLWTARPTLSMLIRDRSHLR